MNPYSDDPSSEEPARLLPAPFHPDMQDDEDPDFDAQEEPDDQHDFGDN